MGKKAEQVTEAKQYHTVYWFDLSTTIEWYGDLDYYECHFTSPFEEAGEISSLMGINIIIPVTKTSSKKIKSGRVVRIRINAHEDRLPEGIGSIWSRKEGLYFYVYLPQVFFNHVQSVLMSGKAKIIHIQATEMFRRRAIISNFQLSGDDNEDKYFCPWNYKRERKS